MDRSEKDQKIRQTAAFPLVTDNIVKSSWQPPGITRRVMPLFTIGAMLLTSGCVSFTYQHDNIEQLLLSHQTAQALDALEDRRIGKRDQIIYFLDKGILLRMQDDFEGSNQMLEQAKTLSQKLSAISLREQAVASSVNDTMRSYLPPPFERVMLHCIKVLNYLQLNDYDNARVETLQMNELLKQQDEEEQQPFAHYLSGLVFEVNGESDNALIAYRNAYEAFQSWQNETPLFLQQDLLRLTQYLGLNDEHEQLSKEFTLEEWPTQKEVMAKSKVVAIIFNGLIPRKHSQEINVQSPKDGQLHRIATPFYEQRAPRIDTVTLRGADTQARSELFEQLDQQAEAALANEMPQIILRAIARVSVKNNMVDNANKESPLLGAVLNLATFFTEVADTRGWYTLPQQILVARLYLEPGEQDIQLDLNQDGNDNTATRISLTKGESHFISLHLPDSYVTSRRPYNETRNAPVHAITIGNRMQRHH